MEVEARCEPRVSYSTSLHCIVLILIVVIIISSKDAQNTSIRELRHTKVRFLMAEMLFVELQAQSARKLFPFP